MTTTALVSGGKDSIYAAYLAETQGWPVDELLVLRPSDPDSLLFHTPNLVWVALQAQAWGKRHREVPVEGGGDAAEVRGLEAALAGATGPVVAGAIESSYQWARLLRVGDRVGRRVYTPLWRKAASRVVRAELDAGLDARLVHLAAEGLPADLLGRRLDASLLRELEAGPRGRAGIHPAGEGGEYETLVLDAPFFRSRIEVDEAEVRASPSTATWLVRKAHLADKPRNP